MPGSLHIFVSSFFVKTTKIPKIGCKIFISMCSVFACLALLSKKVNKLLCNILVTSSPKTTKNQVTKMGWKAQIFFFSNQTKTRLLSTFQKTYGRTSDNNDHISCLGQSSRFITIIQTASRITEANHRICRKSASKKSIS